MEEASQLCDRVILVDNGKILLDGSPAEVIAREVGQTVIEAWNHTPEVAAAARALPGRVEEIGDRLFVYPEDAEAAERLFEERFPRQERQIRRATLEDVFLKRTGRALRE
ncbi:MAG TPA: ABC transporter ATP-binding protein, partial [Candidatus Eisenbacteria bacterium]|nr:ABC transporter ATP-binding protein [Candidatus Eisenbacteria bacterium]